MTVAFVGEAPSSAREIEADRAFLPSTRSGRRLAQLLGVDDAARVGECVNLLELAPRNGKGSGFDHGQAAASAIGYATIFPEDVRLVLVGRRVGNAFGVRTDYLEWTTAHGHRAIVVPHPSGVNRWWNDPKNEVRARRFFRSLAKRP